MEHNSTTVQCRTFSYPTVDSLFNVVLTFVFIKYRVFFLWWFSFHYPSSACWPMKIWGVVFMGWNLVLPQKIGDVLFYAHTDTRNNVELMIPSRRWTSKSDNVEVSCKVKKISKPIEFVEPNKATPGAICFKQIIVSIYQNVPSHFQGRYFWNALGPCRLSSVHLWLHIDLSYIF